MNRSFRAHESQIYSSTRQQPQQQLRQGRVLGSMMKEKEEELALFLEMRKREKERNNLLLPNSDDFVPSLGGSKPCCSPIFKLAPATPVRRSSNDAFLNSNNDKNDYDWLLTPPGTPLFPSLEMDSHKSAVDHIGTPKARSILLKSRLANSQHDPPSRSSLIPRQSLLNTSSNSSIGIRRPSSSGASSSSVSRSATPTGRPTEPAMSKSSRPSTPTSGPTLPSSKPSIPSTRSMPSSRSSTPTSRPSLVASKQTSRAVTPTRRSSTPSSLTISTVQPTRSSSVTRSNPATRNPVQSRGSSPTVRSRPWQPSQMPGFSLDAPPNLRTTIPERLVSASRGKPGAPSGRSSSVERGNGRPRQQSCSPLRGRVANGTAPANRSSSLVSTRSRSNGSDNLSPVEIGSKMVERVVNLRRLVPPKREEQQPGPNNAKGKLLSSPDGTGFGRNLSKKSLDMALRHMDIRRSIPGNLWPLMTNVPASSMYSVRSGSRSRTVSITESPFATSSNASSEQSVNNNILCLDGSEAEDDLTSERIRLSPSVSITR